MFDSCSCPWWWIAFTHSWKPLFNSTVVSCGHCDDWQYWTGSQETVAPLWKGIVGCISIFLHELEYRWNVRNSVNLPISKRAKKNYGKTATKGQMFQLATIYGPHEVLGELYRDWKDFSFGKFLGGNGEAIRLKKVMLGKEEVSISWN